MLSAGDQWDGSAPMLAGADPPDGTAPTFEGDITFGARPSTPCSVVCSGDAAISPPPNVPDGLAIGCAGAGTAPRLAGDAAGAAARGMTAGTAGADGGAAGARG